MPKSSILNIKFLISSVRGFSIIEIFTVIAIVVILIGIVGSSVSVSRQEGRDLRRTSDIKQIQLSLALYRDVNRQYPVNLSAITSGGYIASIPTNPSGGSYVYVAGSGNGTYCLGVLMERNVPADDKNCLGGGYGVNYYEVNGDN